MNLELNSMTLYYNQTTKYSRGRLSGLGGLVTSVFFRNTERGTTLVELLVSILVLAVGIIGTMALLPQAYKGITKAGRVSTLNHLGYQKIDELRTLAASNWSHADVVAGTYPTVPANRMVGSNLPDYSITWVVTNAPTGEVGGIRTIVVTVGYLVYNSSGVAISPTHKQAMTKKFQTIIAD